jgi:hypothetical protein
MRAKITTARFYAEHVLGHAPALRDRVIDGASSVIDMPVEAF